MLFRSRTIAFIFAIAVAVQALELVLRALSPLLHRLLGVYLPLITTNCAILGIALLSVRDGDTFGDALLRAVGSAGGFVLVMILFAGLRERIDEDSVPVPLRGTALALVSASILSLAFMGFAALAGHG